MVRVKSEDEINVPDGLQLGRRKSSTVTVDQTETKDADSEGAKYQVVEVSLFSSLFNWLMTVVLERRQSKLFIYVTIVLKIIIYNFCLS